MSDNNESLENIIAETLEKKKNGQLDNKQTEVQANASLNGDEKKAKDSKKGRSVKGKKKKMSVKKKILIAVLIILLIVGTVVAVGVGIIYHYINKMNIVDDTSNSSYEILDSIEPDDDVTSEPDSPKEDIDELEEQIRKNLEENAVDMMQDEDVYNILLIGTDARDNTSRGRSDSMILVSINQKTEKVIMTSFLRDIYLAIPNIESTRLNHAYAYGGADLLIDTLEQNFKIKIDKYVQVNFFSFTTVVDTVGGVDIDVTDDEVYYINMYLSEINRLEGKDSDSSKLSKGGKLTLNGDQALAYSRIRYIGTDFGRTERQRKVLEQIIQKMNNLSLTEMKELLDVLLPKITTNIQEDEMFSLILNAAKYLGYEREQCRVPADNTWWNLTIRGMAVLGTDFDANIKYLQEHIYG